jgi:hypothetical protein
VPFPFQLWSTFAPLDHPGDAQAGPRCHYTSLAARLKNTVDAVVAEWQHPPLLTLRNATPVTTLVRLLHAADLTRFYRLAGNATPPIDNFLLAKL